jgi:hypothetical protein
MYWYRLQIKWETKKKNFQNTESREKFQLSNTWFVPTYKALAQPCPPRRPRYTFLAPSVSTLFESIINSNFKTKNIFECLSTVKYFHKISLKHGTVLDIP